MKTTRIFLTVTGLAIAGSLVLGSCRKREKTPAQEPDNEQSTAADNALAENVSNDVVAMACEASETNSLSMYSSAGCATLTSNMVGTVVTQYTVDFGTGCTGPDGRTRKGKLFFDMTGSTYNAKRYRHPGFKVDITSSNYVVDNNAVSVNKTISNTTPTNVIGTTAYNGTNLTWGITSNITINKDGGGTVTWSCNRSQELTNTSFTLCYNGQNIPINWTKAVIKINGTATGTNANGESYTATATDLVRDFTCAPNGNGRHPFIKGTVDYKPGSRANRHIDYGDGGCDFGATVVINGQSFTMQLP